MTEPVMALRLDEMSGTVGISATVPNGPVLVTRAVPGETPETIRGGELTVTTSGIVLDDPEPPFGLPLTYRLTVSPANVNERLIQTNRVLNPRMATSTSTWVPGSYRTLARETDAGLVPPRDAVTSLRVSANPGGTADVPGRMLAHTPPDSLSAGRWLCTGQVRRDGTAATSLWVSVVAPNPTVGSVLRRNRVPNPAPASTTGYSLFVGTGGAAALTYVGTGGPTGGGFVRGTWTTANTSAAGTASGASVRADGRAAAGLPIPVTPGEVLSAAVVTRLSVAQRVSANIWFFDAAGASTGITPSSVAGAAQVVTANTWTRMTVENVTVPAGAAYAMVGALTMSGTGSVPMPVGSTWDVAQSVLEAAATVGTYFDGSTPSTTGFLYAWSGGTNASISTVSVFVYAEVVAPVQVIGQAAGSAAAWQTFQAWLTLPAGAPAGARLAFLHGTTAGDYAATWWITTLMVTPEAEAEAPYLVYLDGDSAVPPDAPVSKFPGDWQTTVNDADIYWSGTANASRSVYIGPTQIFNEITTELNAPPPSVIGHKLPVMLSDPVTPLLGAWFELLEIGDLSFAARAEIFDILGRAAQVSVSQIRAWPGGEMRLLTRTLEQKDLVERLFSSGRILYWRIPDTRYPEDRWYIGIGNVTAGRLHPQAAYRPERIWRLPFIKVERPEGLIATATAVTWADVRSQFTWGGLRQARSDWLDVAIQDVTT